MSHQPNNYQTNQYMYDEYDPYNQHQRMHSSGSNQYNASNYSVNASTPMGSSYYESNVYPLVMSALAEDNQAQHTQSSLVPYDPYGSSSPRSDTQQLAIRDGPEELDYYSGTHSHTQPGPIVDKSLLPPKVQRFRQHRKMRTAASAGAGMLVGVATMGPIGIVLGGAGGYVIAKKVGKHREKKLLEKCLNEEAGASGANFKTIEQAVVV